MLRISDFLSLDSVEEIEKEPSRARQLISHVFNPKHNRLHRTVRCQLRFFCESKLIVFKVHKLYHQKTDDSTTLAYQILEKISYIIRYSEMEVRIGFSLMVKNSSNDLKFLYAAKGMGRK